MLPSLYNSALYTPVHFRLLLDHLSDTYVLNIKFQNDVCNTETAMNGTCYTAEECSDRDGVATGTCADGFGVCCVSKF